MTMQLGNAFRSTPNPTVTTRKFNFLLPPEDHLFFHFLMRKYVKCKKVIKKLFNMFLLNHYPFYAQKSLYYAFKQGKTKLRNPRLAFYDTYGLLMNMQQGRLEEFSQHKMKIRF